MVGYQVEMEIDGQRFITLADILPAHPPMKMLVVGKTPAPFSVNKGHYFQGHNGQALWRNLKRYGLLSIPSGAYEDESLIKHGYGVTDVVKRPNAPGEEPSHIEYQAGRSRILSLVSQLQPKAVLFVYLGALTKMIEEPVNYGFNPNLEELFGAKVFVSPLPGVGGQSKDDIDTHWHALQQYFLAGNTTEVTQ